MKVTKAEISRKKKEIGVREMILSSPFRTLMTNSVKAVMAMSMGRLVPVVRLFEGGEDGAYAYTEGQTLHVNVDNPLLQESCSQEEYELTTAYIRGFLMHELGHVLFTPFGEMKKQQQALERGQEYPQPWDSYLLEADRKGEMGLYLKEIRETVLTVPEHRNLYNSLFARVFNIVEDGYIENRLLDAFRGAMANGLSMLRKWQLSQAPSLECVIEQIAKNNTESQKNSLLSHALNVLLIYSKYSTLHYQDKEILKDPFIDKIYDALRYTDLALRENKGSVRLAKTHTVMIALWPFIKPALQEAAEQQKQQIDLLKSVEELLKDMLSKMGSGMGNGSVPEGGLVGHEKMDDEKDNESVEKRSNQLEEISKELGKENHPSKPGGSSGSFSDGNAEDAEENTGDKASGSKGNTPDSEDNEKTGASQTQQENGSESTCDRPASCAASKKSPASSQKHLPREFSSEEMEHSSPRDEEGGRIDNSQKGEVRNEGSGVMTQKDREDTFRLEEHDVSKVLNRIAEGKVERDHEYRQQREMNREASKMNLGGMHSNISINVHRAHAEEADAESYNREAQPLLPVARQAVKKLEPVLKKQLRGTKERHLSMGHRLTKDAPFRQDTLLFERKKLPRKLSVCAAILIDESGSMAWNNRSVSARAAAIVLKEFCDGLNIPVCVYGHDSSGYNVNLYSYCEFDGNSKYDKYRLMKSDARSSNRDGAALSYMYHLLDKRSEKTRILFVISDGQPAAVGYGGQEAEEDMRQIRDSYARKGILTFAAAIGDDRENIERIYREGFLDISSLEDLPQIMVRLFTRYVKAH